MKKQVVEIPRIKVKSINVKSLGYDNKRQIMALEFHNGHLFYYLDIPNVHFENMTNHHGKGEYHPSIGSYLSINVKGNYRYIRVV